MKRAFDPITNTFFIAVAAVVCLLYYFKMKSGLWLAASGALFLWAMLRAYQITESKSGKYPGKVFNESKEGAHCILSEDGHPMILSPQVMMEADGVKTSKYPDKVYKLRNGTNVRITKDGNVRAYSPVSEFVNPGWVGKEYFENKNALTGPWQELFNCN